jgi:hypothetical protein
MKSSPSTSEFLSSGGQAKDLVSGRAQRLGRSVGIGFRQIPAEDAQCGNSYDVFLGAVVVRRRAAQLSPPLGSLR